MGNFIDPRLTLLKHKIIGQCYYRVQIAKDITSLNNNNNNNIKV